MASQDERSLGPLGMLWFLTFLGLSNDLDADGIHEPRLLADWEYTPDYTEWTLHVRKGLRWGDGEPVTAEDVKFSLDLWSHTDIWYQTRYYDKLEVLDSHTLRMTFPEPVRSTVHVYSWLAILPEHLLGHHSIDDGLFSWPFWVEPVGNGPFRYVRHIPDVMTELEANPHYYGEPPRIQKVVLRYGGNALTELLAGNVDLATDITPAEAARLAMDSRFELHFSPRGREVTVAWNHRIPLFQDAAVRRALTMSIDRKELLGLIGYPEETPIFDVPVTDRHYHPDHRPGIPEPLPFAPDRARQLLASAGWVDADGDGVREKDDREFRFDLVTTPKTSVQAVYLQHQLRDVGVAVQIQVMDLALHRDRLRRVDFDAAIELANYINGFDEFRLAGYRNPEVSRLFDLASSFDPEQADRHLVKLWEIMLEEVPITYLHPELEIIAADRRVRGMPTNPKRYRFVEHLWIEETPLTVRVEPALRTHESPHDR